MPRRNTVQRELVLQAVRNLKTHSTADEIYLEITRDHPSVGRGTVYRNLAILAGEGLIRRVSFPGEADRFDWNTDPHCHVKCVKCGRFFDVDTEPLPRLENMVKDGHGMEFLSFDIIFSGICPDCQKTEAE